MTDFGKRFGDMFKSDYDPDEDGVIAVAQTEAVKYVDRGDVAAYDFGIGDFTINTLWHALDLSAILPAGATTAHIYVHAYCTVGGMTIQLREYGNSNAINIRKDYIPADATARGFFWFVNCDADRVIEYLIDDETWIFVNFVVVGWFV